MSIRKKMRFRTKLALLFLFIGMMPVVLLGYLNSYYAHKILHQQTINQLISLKEDRKTEVQAFFKQLRSDAKMLADHRLLKDILADYITAYNKGGLDGGEFKAVDKRCHGRCVGFCKEYGYEDILFVNNKGDVLITVKKGADWGTNLISGIYSDTELAECFKKVNSGIISIVDFKEHSSSGGPVAVIGAPMIRREERKGFKAGEKIGVLIIRIHIDQINAFMMKKDGVGDTGETYLIGKDMLMRSDSRFLKESAVLKVKAETAAVMEAVEGRSGHKEHVVDYRGELVSVAYGPAEIEGLDWAVVAKKDHKEILKSTRTLRNQSLIIALLVAIGVVLADLLFVRGIRKPIIRMREAADKIAAGDFAVRAPVEIGGEIGRLAVCFNHMTQSLIESRAKIEEYSNSLEEKVEIKTKALEMSRNVLAETNARLQQIYDSTPVGMRIIDREFNIVAQNETMCKLTGWSQETAKRKKCYEEFYGTHCNTEQCSLRKIMEHGGKTVFEVEKTLPDGKKVPFRIISIPFRNSAGIITGIIETFIDITEYRNLEAGNHTQQAHNEIVTALNTELEIEPLLKSIIGKIADHTDSQLGVIYLYEKESKSLCPGSTYAVDRDILGDGFRLGHGLPGQSALERRSILVADVPENYFRISSGGMEGVPKNIICVPITIKEQLIGVLELASIHEYTDSRLEFLNMVAYQLGIGINNALTYLRLEEMAEDLKEKNELMAAQNEELQAQNEELQSQSEEIQAQSEELISQKKEIEEKSERVEETNRLKSEFLSNMSHELRTPLNSILGLTNLMGEEIAGPINEKQKEYVEIVERNGKNLLQLINDILDLSKIESGKVDLSISRIELKRFIRSVSSSIMPLVEQKGLSLTIDVDDDIFIYCDVDKLRQILVNLIGNAAKFTEKGGISISAVVEEEKLHNKVIIKFGDTGIGIPADAMKYIFKPFRQVDGSLTREHGGTGLGLSICYNLVKLMGGKIEVESVQGKGSAFIVTLLKDRRSKSRPKEKDWKKNVKAALVQETGKELPAPDKGACKILIIDDDPIIIKEMKILFKEENCHLTFALTGSEGLLLLNKYIPDLILLDLRMPGMDGFKVLEELQRRENLKDLPVMILTAADLTEDEKKGLGKNVKGVITKGQIDKSTLLSMINKELYRQPGAGITAGRQATEEKEKMPEKTEPEKTKSDKTGPAKILIAEDRDDNLIFLKEILSPVNYRIYVAKNGQEAVDIAGEERPDLILMDMQMPVMNGFDATKLIRKIKELKDVPIIGLTARAMKGDREKVIAAGCSDYLSKPVMPNDLLRKVEEWIHKISENSKRKEITT